MTITTASRHRYCTTMPSPIGELMLLGDGESITGVFMNVRRWPPTLPTGLVEDLAPFGVAIEQLDAYFAGDLTEFDLPLARSGTPFQQRVWDALHEVGYGTTVTYGWLARRVANPTGSRAVGLAVGRNPISIVVPCHRVVGSNGSLTGYGGGLERKRWLLDHEQGAGRLI